MSFFSFSSHNLQEAATVVNPESRKILQEVSGFDAVSKALQKLFFKTVYYANSCAACNISFGLYQRLVTGLNEQMQALDKTNKQNAQDLVSCKKKAELEFQKDWDLRSGKKWLTLEFLLKSRSNVESIM